MPPSVLWHGRKKRSLVSTESRIFVTSNRKYKKCSYLCKIWKLISRTTNGRFGGRGREDTLFMVWLEGIWEGSDHWLQWQYKCLSYLKIPPLMLVCAYQILLRTSPSPLIYSRYSQFKPCLYFSVPWEAAVWGCWLHSQGEQNAGVSPSFPCLKCRSWACKPDVTSPQPLTQGSPPFRAVATCFLCEHLIAPVEHFIPSLKAVYSSR